MNSYNQKILIFQDVLFYKTYIEQNIDIQKDKQELIDFNLFQNPTLPNNKYHYSYLYTNNQMYIQPNEQNVQPNQQEPPSQNSIINTQSQYNSPFHDGLHEVFSQLSLESIRQNLPCDE